MACGVANRKETKMAMPVPRHSYLATRMKAGRGRHAPSQLKSGSVLKKKELMRDISRG